MRRVICWLVVVMLGVLGARGASPGETAASMPATNAGVSARATGTVRGTTMVSFPEFLPPTNLVSVTMEGYVSRHGERITLYPQGTGGTTNFIAPRVSTEDWQDRVAPIVVTDTNLVREIYGFFEDGCPLTKDSPRMGCAQLLVTFKSSNGDSMEAAVSQQHWECGGYSGHLKEGWEDCVMKLMAAAQRAKTNSRPSTSGNQLPQRR